jgi:N12 class adenine-specific DNA methylase
MEQRRLGLIRKPVICVKNHLLDQFRDEFLWAYPQARVLCADTDALEGDGRRQFIARCAAESPDAIIMTRGAFEAIPLTREGHEAYLDYMKQMFTVHAASVADSVADQETLLAEFEQKLRDYFDPGAQEDDDKEQHEEQGRARRKRKVEQDPGMCWEQMGIDYICVDESQDFNNLWVPSSEPGMGIGFVHRSIDLEMKLHAIRRRYGSRAGALATGTPVTNKIAQFYVLQRYLRPERLAKAGFAGYAPWAATYTEPEQRLEMKAGGGFGLVTRMRLINFPELLLDLHYFGDFKDADDIGLQRPAIRGGKAEIRGIPAVTELTAYQGTLPERYGKAKGGRKRKGDDTVVAVIGDGFRAAQDLRLVKAYHGEKPALTDEPQKIDHIADDVYGEWLAHRDDT